MRKERYLLAFGIGGNQKSLKYFFWFKYFDYKLKNTFVYLKIIIMNCI